VVHDDLGGYYVVDSGNNRIQKFTENDRFEFQWGSRGSREGRFIRPQAIARDEDGNIFIVDTGNNRVQKFDDRGEFILEWGRLGSSPGKFMDPIDITFDADGDIYILDAGNERIQKFSPSTAFEEEWGGFTGGRQGDFTRLVSIAFDDDRLGLLQLLGDGIEEGTCQIQILDLRGGRKEVVRSWDLAYPGDDEVPCFPTRIRIDNRDNYVYILDHVNSVLRRYQKDGRYLDSIWEVEEPMNGPMGLSVESGTRKIWIADTGSNAIQRFTLR
jgi:DNA-binding beta-propeller fold protein YncE